jgi:putative transposase
MLAKSVYDAAWGNFGHWLRVKAEEAAREVVEVDPRGTSQTCSQCGREVRKSLAVRVHRCQDCGLTIDRDVNAALNIKGAGMALRREAPRFLLGGLYT